MGVPQNIPKWMADKGKSHLQMDDYWGYPYDLGNHQMEGHGRWRMMDHEIRHIVRLEGLSMSPRPFGSRHVSSGQPSTWQSLCSGPFPRPLVLAKAAAPKAKHCSQHRCRGLSIPTRQRGFRAVLDCLRKVLGFPAV